MWHRLNNYTRFALIGFVILIVGTMVCDFITWEIRKYEVRGDYYTQTLGDLVYYLSIDICLLSWAIYIRHKSKFEKLIRCTMQLATDFFIWDMFFLCVSNPYEWNKSKLFMYGLSLLTFLVVYWFEYVSLIGYNMKGRIKSFFKKE